MIKKNRCTASAGASSGKQGRHSPPAALVLLLILVAVITGAFLLAGLWLHMQKSADPSETADPAPSTEAVYHEREFDSVRLESKKPSDDEIVRMQQYIHAVTVLIEKNRLPEAAEPSSGVFQGTFSVGDIDDDGHDELILHLTGDSEEQKKEFVYDYDIDNRTMYPEFSGYSDNVTYFNNGLIKADVPAAADRNTDSHILAESFKVYQCNKETDSYILKGNILHWDRNRLQHGESDEKFPVLKDPDGDGIVYEYPDSEDASYGATKWMEQKEFHEWFDSLARSADIWSISWYPLSQDGLTKFLNAYQKKWNVELPTSENPDDDEDTDEDDDVPEQETESSGDKDPVSADSETDNRTDGLSGRRSPVVEKKSSAGEYIGMTLSEIRMLLGSDYVESEFTDGETSWYCREYPEEGLTFGADADNDRQKVRCMLSSGSLPLIGGFMSDMTFQEVREEAANAGVSIGKVTHPAMETGEGYYEDEHVLVFSYQDYRVHYSWLGDLEYPDITNAWIE